jgi:hypothetical protein
MRYESRILSKKKANIFGKRLELVEKKYGKLTPEFVVQDASKISSPLHNFFEWDNEKASDNWRKHQARMLINSFTIVSEDNGSEDVPAFYNIKISSEPKTQEYVSIDKAVDHADYIKSVALRELKAWIVRYKQFVSPNLIFKNTWKKAFE